jgi:hypothetical protein
MWNPWSWACGLGLWLQSLGLQGQRWKPSGSSEELHHLPRSHRRGRPGPKVVWPKTTLSPPCVLADPWLPGVDSGLIRLSEEMQEHRGQSAGSSLAAFWKLLTC